jgi:hypothetical protein
MSNVATYKHHKHCSRCRKLKLKTEFYTHPRNGLAHVCKDCHRAEMTANYKQASA